MAPNDKAPREQEIQPEGFTNAELRRMEGFTENEIFDSGFGKDEDATGAHDPTGDRSLENMGEGLEGQDEADADESDEDEGEGEEGEEGEGKDGEEGEGDEGEEGDGAAEEAAATPPEPRGRVPSGRLREQTERAQRAEESLRALQTERDADRTQYRKDMDELRTQMTGLVTALQRGPQPAQPARPEPETPPDVFENPNVWGDGLVKRAVTDASTQAAALANQVRVDNSFMIAEAVHGETFTKAWEACNKLDANNPDDRTTVQRILQSRNPGRAVIDWHQRAERDRSLGTESLEAHDERIRKEARQAAMEDPEFRRAYAQRMRAEASGQGGTPARNITRLPRSLNGAAGSSVNNEAADPLANDDSDSAVFSSAWR